MNAKNGLRGYYYQKLLENVGKALKECLISKREELVTNLHLINKLMPQEIWQRASIQNLALAIIFRCTFENQFPFLKIYCDCIDKEGVDRKVKYQNLLSHIQKVIDRNISAERNVRMALRLNLIEQRMNELIKDEPELKDLILKLKQKLLKNFKKPIEGSENLLQTLEDITREIENFLKVFSK